MIAKCDRSVDGIDVRDWVLGAGNGGFLRGKELDRDVWDTDHPQDTLFQLQEYICVSDRPD